MQKGTDRKDEVSSRPVPCNLHAVLLGEALRLRELANGGCVLKDDGKQDFFAETTRMIIFLNINRSLRIVC